MRNYLVSIGDSAPFLDALTTVMSLAAQYLLTKKFIENWYIWLAVDVIYVGLYFSRGLYLTAVLYAIFFGMCLVGLKEWRANKVEHLALAERGSDV
jgi:nicotinamide mononucleotide transporter